LSPRVLLVELSEWSEHWVVIGSDAPDPVHEVLKGVGSTVAFDSLLLTQFYERPVCVVVTYLDIYVFGL
jgi:hypothetical protein